MKRSIVFLIHTAIWLLLYAITYIISDTFLNLIRPKFGVIPGQVSAILALSILALIAVPFYIFYFLFPQLTAHKKKLYPYPVAITLLILLPLLFLKLDNKVITVSTYSTGFLFCLFFSLLGALFSSFFRWMEQMQLRVDLEKQQLVSELAMLRMQLNPHFLFNALHNIDTLIKREPDTASDLLIQLSGLMRYLLYESRGDKVLLKQEIEYIQNYISLHQLRFTRKDFINFTFKGEAGNVQIAPMLLIPFIENTFKHHKKENTTDEITIELEVTPQQIYLHCANSYEPQDKNKDQASGIGLSTIKRRLELLYPGKHTLLIENKPPVFDVQLTLYVHEN